MTRRHQILTAFIARLATITIANSFTTNAGQKIYANYAPELLSKDEPDTAIAVLIEDDTHEEHGDKLLIELPLLVCSLAKASLDDPLAAAEDVLGDVKRAVEIDTHLGGLLRDYMRRGSTQTFKREQGTTTVGSVVPYILPYSEKWGAPGV